MAFFFFPVREQRRVRGPAILRQRATSQPLPVGGALGIREVHAGGSPPPVKWEGGGEGSVQE